jgi:dTDP-4-dehydrorhamnose 3,5-epimerase
MDMDLIMAMVMVKSIIPNNLKMELIETGIEHLNVFKPRIFEDHRGYFFESFNLKQFQELSHLAVNFVQDNQSLSMKNVLRGLHLQVPPYTQGKLVRVVKGSVLDVAVDLRKSSKTFGQYFSIELSAANQLQMYVPEGFAHGFLSLEDNTIFEYKCTHYYHPASERTIVWNDTQLNIDWKCDAPILAEKDLSKALTFNQFNSPF